MKVLVVDDFEEMRELLEFVFTAHMGMTAVVVSSGRQAIEKLKSGHEFDLIVSDLNMPDGTGADLFKVYQKLKLSCPFVIMSSDDRQKYPALQTSALHWIEKPFDILNFKDRLEKILDGEFKPEQSYVPVALTLLRKMQKVQIPLFVRINEQKFIRLQHSSGDLSAEEYDRYQQRGLSYAYIESASAHLFIADYRKKVLSLDAWKEPGSFDQETISLNIELLKNMSTLLGWDSRTVELARSSVLKTLQLAKRHPLLQPVLNQFQKIESFGFADHCTLTLLVSIGLLNQMGYADEVTLSKVAFASVLHDFALTDEEYKSKKSLIKRMEKGDRHSQDVQNVYDHAIRSSQLCQSWDFCPPGVDKIILHHHERPDGRGFPLGASSGELDFICSLFVVAEDFSDFFIDMLGKPDLPRYFESRKSLFSHGHFSSVFRALRSRVVVHDKSRAS